MVTVMVYKIAHGIVRYGATTILSDINFEIRNTEKIAVIGRNGCGKSTLLKLIAGIINLDNLDSDEDSYIAMSGKPSIGYLQQISFEDDSLLVEEELRKTFAPILRIEEKMKELTKKMEANTTELLLKEYALLQEQYELLQGYTYEIDMETVFTKFGFELTDLKRPLSSFSGGQQTKIAFVKLLLSKPDIMLLDEPTNHLDMETIEWLEGYLRKYPKAVVIVSHDRMFLDHITDVTYEIEYTRMKYYAGNYSYFLKRKQLDYEKLVKDYAAQQKEIERLTTIVDRFKNKPTKAAMARSKLKQIEHMVKIEDPVVSNTRSFREQIIPRLESGKEVLRVSNLEVGYDKPLCKVSMELLRSQKLAVIGGNGVGKSTLLKTLVGKLEPIGGSYSYGLQVEVGYFEQQLALYTNDKRVIDEFWDEYPTLTQTQVRTALGSFCFTQDEVYKNLAVLSGGEKVRLYLAKLFQKRPNLLILDEPTNHMDIIGKESLERMIRQYEGTALCVSHDRFFIKEIADSLLVFEEDGIHYYSYGYEEYMERNIKPLIEKEETRDQKHIESIEKGKYKDKYKEKDTNRRKFRNIEHLENKIASCEDNIKMWKNQMNDPNINCDFLKLKELMEAVSKEEEKLDHYMTRWEETLD